MSVVSLSADVRFAVRMLRRTPGFTVIAVLTLAIGIGGTTAVFSAVDAVLIEPLPFQQPGQLVRLYENDTARHDVRGWVTPVHFVEYRASMPAFAATAAIQTYRETGADIGAIGNTRRIRVLQTSAEYVDVLQVRPAMGRFFDRGDETAARLVVLGDRLWREQFGGRPDAIGSTLEMDGASYRVIGIMPAGFEDPLTTGVAAWVPIDMGPGYNAQQADNHYLAVIARLRPGVSLERAQAELDALSRTLRAKYPNARNARGDLAPLKDDIVGASSHALTLMLGAVGVVLLLVCVNLASLLLVRASDRARELSVRAALGADRGRLTRQILVESLVLAALGDLVGLVIATVAMQSIVALGGGAIPRLTALRLDPRLLLFSVTISTICAIAFGVAPARRAARVDPTEVLRGEPRSSTGGARQLRFRDWLVASQVALAFVLLVGVGLLVASIERLRETNLGIDAHNVLTFEVNLPSARYDSTARAHLHASFDERLAALPGVVAAGSVSRLPGTGPYHSWGVEAYTGPFARRPDGNPAAQNRIVSGDYFRAVGIPLLDGRLFEPQDIAGAPERAIISRSLARRLFPGLRAVGQRLNTGGRTADVIGVVGDVSVDAEGGDAFYVYHAHAQWAGDRNWPLAEVIRTARPPLDVLGDARRALAGLDPLLVVFRPTTLEDAIGRGEATRTFTLRVLGAFTMIATVLAAVGLFGVLSYGVRLRVREFAIRMALGAERETIRRMVLGQGLRVVGRGIGVGVIAALAVSRAMTSLVFHVSPTDPTVLAGAAALMVVVGACAAYVPARRATSAEPRSALE